MQRRDSFRTGARRLGKAAVHEVERKVTARAARWVRPPFAQPELEFLMLCTRCAKCIEACAHDVVFALATGTGADAAATPALDLMNRGCHLCEGWPCVTACEPGALQLPVADGAGDPAQLALPMLARAAVDPAVCLPYRGPECGACAGACPVPGALTWQGPKPTIDSALCIGCAQCREACIVEPKAITVRSVHATS